MDRLSKFTDGFLKKDPPKFQVGDTVDVQVQIQEGDKERVQTFSGIVIAMRGRGVSRSFTVRRIVQGEGVERVFPLHSPFILDVISRKRSKVRRAKLYYLRGRSGKKARMKEQLDFHAEALKSIAKEGREGKPAKEVREAKPAKPAEKAKVEKQVQTAKK